MNKITIKKIILENFRSHKHLELTFDMLNILIGENGSGKSSVLEAISYALFGSVANGSKKSELVRHGEKSGGITLIFSNDYKIVRDFSTDIRLLDNNDKIITNKANEIESYLNIDKEVFMNILYASQNEIHNYFTKFNAKEKDFIDSIFNLDNLTDNITNSIKSSIAELTSKYNDISNKINTRKLIESNIKEILENCHMESIEGLLHAINIANQNLQELIVKQKDYNSKQSMLMQYNKYQYMLEEINARIDNYNNMVSNDDQDIKKRELELFDYIKEINNKFNTNINSVDNIGVLFKELDSNCDIRVHLSNIRSFAKEALENKELMERKLNDIINTIEIIDNLDNYRRFYNEIKDKFNRLLNNYNIAISSSNNNKKQLEYMRNESNNIQSSISNMNLEDIRQDGNEDFNNLIMQYNSQYTLLKTTYDNIVTYKNQLDSIISDDINEELLQEIQSQIQVLNKMLPIFSRDGFIAFLRKSLLKDIANNIGESLEKFGFFKLLPVTIDEKSSALLFHNRLFRSLSGGEKTITSILLRVIFSRILSPSMKLNILILDEPTSDLDSTRILHLRQLLQKLNKLLNIQIIVVTHDQQAIPDNANVINISIT